MVEQVMTKKMMEKQTTTLVKKVVEEVMGKVRRLIDETYIPKIVEKLNTHEKILRGNGRKGLVEQVAVLADQSADFKKHIETFEAFMTKSQVQGQATTDTLKQISDAQGTIKTDITEKLDTLTKRLAPLEKVGTSYIRHVTIVGTACGILGAALTFLIVNFSSIVEALSWMFKAKHP